MEFGHLWRLANESLGQRNMPSQVVRVPVPQKINGRHGHICTCNVYVLAGAIMHLIM